MLSPGNFSFLQDSLSCFCSFADAFHDDVQALARAVVDVIVIFAGCEVDSNSPVGLFDVVGEFSFGSSAASALRLSHCRMSTCASCKCRIRVRRVLEFVVRGTGVSPGT